MLKVGERVRVIFAGNGVLKDTTKTESGIKIYIVELENGETVRTTEDRIDLYREGK